MKRSYLCNSAIFNVRGDPLRIHGQTYEHTTVELDGNSYDECTFVGCRLIYSGLGPVGLSGCSLRNCAFAFQGSAANAVAFLNGLAGDPGLRRALIEILPNILSDTNSRRHLN
jgi:hypothetical protein